jgi:hypothetical protein
MGVAFAPSSLAIAPSLLLGDRNPRSIIIKVLGLLLMASLLFIPSTTDVGRYSTHGFSSLIDRAEMLLWPPAFGKHLGNSALGWIWLPLWVVGTVRCWKRGYIEIIALSWMTLIGWILLPVDVPRAGGVLGARYVVPLFLSMSLVIAIWMADLRFRFGVGILTLLIGLMLLPVASLRPSEKSIESVEWGMLLPVIAARLPSDALPSPSTDRYWSVVAGMQVGWNHQNGILTDEQLRDQSEGWGLEFWSGIGVVGANPELRSYPFTVQRQHCLGVQVRLANLQKSPSGCWTELGTTLIQQKPSSSPSGFEQGFVHRRNHWPKAKDIEFQNGFSHPLASSRRAIDPQVLGGKVK